MLLSRDFVAHMSRQLTRRLVAADMLEAKDVDHLTERVRHALMDELTIEDRLNEEVRNILNQYSDEMRRSGASYQEMYKKVKNQLARDRKLVLR